MKIQYLKSSKGTTKKKQVSTVIELHIFFYKNKKKTNLSPKKTNKITKLKQTLKKNQRHIKTRT